LEPEWFWKLWRRQETARLPEREPRLFSPFGAVVPEAFRKNKNVPGDQSNSTAVCSNIKLTSFYWKALQYSYNIKVQSVMSPYARLMVVAETSCV
jgi:hypothetical protein